MKASGLRIRLISVAVAAGICISAVLFMLEYLEYRRATTLTSALAERALVSAEVKRLERMANSLALMSAAPIEAALHANDIRAVQQHAAALMSNPQVLAVTVTRPDGQVLFTTRRQDAIVDTLAPEEKRQLKRDLGGTNRIGAIEVEVGRAGILDSAGTLHTELSRVEGEDFRHSLWLVAVVGALITAVLAFLAWILSQRLERPIVELIRSAERIGEGDYTRPHKVTSNDEIAELEVALDRMRQNLRQTTITKNYLKTVLNSMNDAVLVTSPERHRAARQRCCDPSVRLHESRDRRQAVRRLDSRERARGLLDGGRKHRDARDGHRVRAAARRFRSRCRARQSRPTIRSSRARSLSFATSPIASAPSGASAISPATTR